MKVAICDLNYHDSDKQYHLTFEESDLTIKMAVL